YRVKSSDNLTSIAAKQYDGSGLTRSQILVGIYASNPKSFKNGNINKLLRGQKLILPDADKIGKISHGEAELVLSARKKGKKKRFKKRVKSSKSKRKSKSRKKRKVISASQKRSIKKIKKLEKEGETLKARLEKLMADKAVSDNKLKELEGSLQEALKKTAAIATVSTVSEVTKPEKDISKTPAEKTKEASESDAVTKRANEKLREKNALLEQKLQESKKEIASKARAKLEKEQAIKEPQKPVINKTDKADVSDPSKENQGVKASAENKIQSTSGNSTSTFDSSNKYLQWALLSLLIFPLVWFARRFITAKKVKEQPAWVVAAEEPNDMLSTTSERMNTHYQEAPLESSIKLDVASAYLDAGDTDEAILILNEIVLEGSEEQQAQAQALLNSL
ncbi:MAG TPA: hypothetical protein EYG71_04370, partial [Leucothrix sp.]|nr:hypothetical protein [Leucothrix sp.]